jgi:hypothetical protein
MGKKNESKYDKLTWTGKRAADKKMAEHYGVDISQYGNTGRPGGGGIQKKSWDDLSSDVARAAANDYDVRRTIELAQESGNKKAQKLGQGISNASEAYAATRFMEKTHKNRMDNGGAYDGANDQGGVTNFWKQRVMDKRDASLEDRFGQQEIETPESKPVAEVPRELSDRGKAAMDTAGDYSFKPVDRGLGNENVAYDPNAGIGDTNAGEFLSNYKKDIQTGIAKDGTPGRGAMSLHNRF